MLAALRAECNAEDQAESRKAWKCNGEVELNTGTQPFCGSICLM